MTGRISSMGKITWAVFGSALLVIAVSGAFLFGLMGWASLAGLALLFIGTALLNLSSTASRGWLLALVLLGVFAVPLVLKLTGISGFGAWQVALLCASPLGLLPFVADVRQHKTLGWAMALFAIGLAIGIISSVAGRSRLDAAAYQFVSDLKPWFLVILGYALRWNLGTERWLERCMRWLWVPMLLFVLAEWFAPSAYYQLFPGASGRSRASADPTGFFPSRAVGIFEHPSFLATTAALLAILAAAKIGTLDRGRTGLIALVFIYMALIVCAVQRQEIAACAIALALITLLSRPDQIFWRFVAVLVASMLAGVAFWLVFAGNLNQELAMWGFGTIGPVEHPRAQIFRGAFSIAGEMFPFGSGLGTFAGAGAEKFDQSMYQALGFRNYWWFGREDFLMDTYWPNSIAEFGYFGAALLFLSYVMLLAFGAVKAITVIDRQGRCYWLAATGMMIYTLLLSVSSPAFQDPRLFVLPAIMFGVASQLSKRAAKHA